MKINSKLFAIFFVASLSISALLFATDFKSSYTSESQEGVYTSWNTSWQFVKPGTGTFFFAAQAKNDIHIAISDAAETKDPMYEIVIGGWSNSKSALRRNSQGDIFKSSTKAIRNTENKDTYWVSLNAQKSTISVGYGIEAGKNIIIEWKDPHFLAKSRFFALSSWDSVIEYTNISLAPDKKSK